MQINFCLNKKTTETEEPSSSLIQFEPQDSNEMNVDQDPEIISSSYYQKADNENDDLKINVQQKGKKNV